MGFKEQILDDAKNVFMDTETGFAESIVYVPYGGSRKTISAVVERRTLEPTRQGGTKVPGRDADITILNDATDGVTTVKKGEDKVELPVWPGGDNVEWGVVDILEKDEAMFVLKIKR